MFSLSFEGDYVIFSDVCFLDSDYLEFEYKFQRILFYFMDGLGLGGVSWERGFIQMGVEAGRVGVDFQQRLFGVLSIRYSQQLCESRVFGIGEGREQVEGVVQLWSQVYIDFGRKERGFFEFFSKLGAVSCCKFIMVYRFRRSFIYIVLFQFYIDFRRLNVKIF